VPFFRQKDGGRFVKDLIALRDEKVDGKPLLEAVMKYGWRQQPAESLDTVRGRLQKDFDALSDGVKAVNNPIAYPVVLAPGLEALQKSVVHQVIEKELGES